MKKFIIAFILFNLTGCVYLAAHPAVTASIAVGSGIAASTTQTIINVDTIVKQEKAK